METITKTKVTVETVVNVPVEKVWEIWTEPKHIVHWNFASIDWQTTYSENDLRVGGKYFSRMEAKDGSSGFDLVATYTTLELYKLIEYIMTDGRRVRITFEQKGAGTRVTETFDAETTNSIEMQQDGWQSILNNFKLYAESPYPDRMLHFETEINADTETVWKTMINENQYREWTSVFNSTSGFRGSWEKGSKILFTGTNNEGKEEGMVSRIKENIPGKFISIEHLGILKNGVEITCGPDVDDWQGALENYTFQPRAGKTILGVDIDVNSTEFTDYFKQTWPKALEIVRQLSEKNINR
ncbi:MAG TPA: SRPBCC domain-containing protein [Bacteroidales bacterium]|nr:SRPBCC domain-containing protein [Bacteroidales bacterium]